MKGQGLGGRRRKGIAIKAQLTLFHTDCTNLEYSAEGRSQPFLFWHYIVRKDWLLTWCFLFSICPLPADSGRRIILKSTCQDEQIYLPVKELRAGYWAETAGKLSDPVPRKGDSVKISELLKEVMKKDPPSTYHVTWQPGATCESTRTTDSTGHLQLWV